MEKTTLCKNCNHRFHGNFCNHCGQAADTHKLSLHHIWHDLQHGLFHFDNGIFYTSKQLLTRPGNAIRDFINGKRVRYFKPLSFVIVLATLYGLLNHYLIDKSFDEQHIQTANDVVDAYEKVTRWIFNHLAYAALILTFTTTLASHLVFKKQGYNLAEHLVLNTYYRGLVLVIALLLFPLSYLSHRGGAEGLKTYAWLAQMIDFLLMYWCYAQFFNQLTKLQSLALTALTHILMTIINLAIGLVAGWIFGMLA